MIAYALSPLYANRLKSEMDVFMLVCLEILLIDLPAILAFVGWLGGFFIP